MTLMLAVNEFQLVSILRGPTNKIVVKIFTSREKKLSKQKIVFGTRGE